MAKRSPIATNPTIYDVARAAGVSLATVSRVSRNGSNVKPETRNKVLEAMRALGYTPNLLASALMTGRTKTIGLLVPDITNPFFAEICRGVEDAGAAAGFSVVICNTDEQVEKERQHANLLRQKGVDGIIFASAVVGDPIITELHRINFPMVLVVRGMDELDLPTVVVDDFEGGYIATQHLIRLGHRRIALLCGPLHTKPALSRKKGFEAAMEQAGLPIDPLLTEAGPFTLKSGIAMMEQLLARNSVPPTGVVGGNDLIAIGAIKVLHRRGIRVPEDVSIVGYDRTSLAEAFEPELTSVAQPAQELGSRALAVLVEMAAARTAQQPPPKIVLPPTLVRGATTAPLCSKTVKALSYTRKGE